jgi:lysophospholipase L1-like esterase
MALSYEDIVQGAYGAIGRTGIGTRAGTIDQEGYNFWLDALKAGVVTPDQLYANFNKSVAETIQQQPQAANSQAVAAYIAANPLATQIDPKKVVAVGDSTTWGYNAGNQVTENMVTTAQKALGSDYSVSNLGINSTTAGDFLNSGDFDKALSSGAGTVVLNYGMNEAYKNVDPTTFANNLLTAVQTLQAVGKKVILQTPNATGAFTKPEDAWTQNVGAYANIVRDVAKQTGTTLDDKFTYTSNLSNATSAADIVHPTATTYGLLGTNLADAIKTTTTGVAPKAISVTAPVASAQTPSLVANQGTTVVDTAAAPATVTDYQGRAYDSSTILNLAKQITASIDPNAVKGGVFSTSGESVGFNFDEASRLLGRAPTASEQVVLDMARHLSKEGVTDLNQVDATETNRRFGSTFTGGGGTIYEIKKDAEGKPIISTWSRDTSNKKAILTALALAALAFGIPGVSEELLSTAAAGETIGTTALTAAEAAGLGLTASEAAALGLSATEFAAAAGTAGAVAGTVAGMGTGTGLTAGSAGLGINATGTAGLGATGTGAGITAGTGLTGTGILTGSTLGTGLLGTGAGLAGLTGTGVLSGSTLGTNLLGTTGTGALTGTGVLTGSNLGTQLLGTGAGTAATVGGVTGLTNTANVGLGALGTGVTTGLTGLGAGALNTGVNVTGAGTGVGAGTVTGTGVGTGTVAGTGLTANQIGSLLSSGLTLGGGLLQSQTSREAAIAAQQRIDAETAAAKQAAAFRPVGMTTRFGTSQFQVDPVTGQLVSAGYTLSPEAKAQQDRFMALSNAGLTQAEGAQAQFAPLQTGAQRLFGLGNQYLAQSPESVAQNYLNQQMALLQPGRELELATLQNRLQQQGRGGLAVAQGGTMGATTPELQALYNARAQQEAQLAANAQQAGQQQVAFGAGLLGQGAQTMGQYYGGQQAAYAPYTTAFGQVQGLEALGQQPFTIGAQLGKEASTAGARVGQLGLQGAGQSVALATGQAATNNPYANVLGGLGASPAFNTAAGNFFSGLFS